MNGPYFGPCTTICQYRDREDAIQNNADAELEAARQLNSFSFGRRHKFTNTRLGVPMTTDIQELRRRLDAIVQSDHHPYDVQLAIEALGIVEKIEAKLSAQTAVKPPIQCGNSHIPPYAKKVGPDTYAWQGHPSGESFSELIGIVQPGINPRS